MKKLQLVSILTALVLSAAPVIASDPDQSGWATFVGSNPMTLQWNVEVETILDTSLVNSNGIITVAVSGGYEIICIENATGQILWKTRSPNELSGTPEISATHGLVLSSTKLGEVVAYSIKTGQKVFNVSTGWEDTSPPVLSQTYLLVRGFDPSTKRAAVNAINIGKGQIAWRVSSAYTNHSPCASGGRVFIADDKELKAISEQDGAPLWKADLKATPEFGSVRGKTLVFTIGNELFTINPETGKEIRSHKLDSQICFAPSIDGSLCLVVTDKTHKLTCLDLLTGTILWTKENQEGFLKAQIWNGGFIIPAKNCIETVEPKTGKQMWDISFTGRLTAAPVAVSDYMIIPTSQKVYAFRNAGYEIQVGINSLDLGMMTNDEPFSYSSIQVSNLSGAIQNITCQSSDPWLKVLPEKIEIGAHDSTSISLTADMRNVDDGSYNSKVLLIWPAGKREFNVSARKVKPEVARPPKPGWLTVNKTVHDNSARLGQPNPTFEIGLENTGELEADYSLVSNAPWILITNHIGKIRGKEHIKIIVCLVTEHALMGKNDGLITIKSNSSGQSIDYFVHFWRDKGIQKTVCQFTLGDSIATISGIKVRARPEPFFIGNTLMLPLNYIQLVLDCPIEVDGKIHRLKRGNISIVFTEGSDICEVFTPAGLQKIQMGAPTSTKSSMIVVPVEPIRDIYDGVLNRDFNHFALELKLPEI